MINSDGMAMLNSVQDLQESVLGHPVVTNKVTLLGNIGEQITFGAKLNDHKNAIRTVQDADQGNHIGMLASLVVQGDLAALEAVLARVQAGLGKGLDGIGDLSVQVDGLVDDTIGSNSKNRDQFQPSGKHTAKTVLRCQTCGKLW